LISGGSPIKTWHRGEPILPKAKNVHHQNGWMIALPCDLMKSSISTQVGSLLENKLKGAGWTSQPAVGDKNSGTGKILTSPDGQSSVRIMTRPDGSSYARIYNGPSGGIESGEQPLNLQGKPGSKNDTHFNLPP